MKRVLNKINGNAPIFKLVVELIILGIFAWTFIQVRDLPTQYCSRAEAHQIKQEFQHYQDLIYKELQDINKYLRHKR